MFFNIITSEKNYIIYINLHIVVCEFKNVRYGIHKGQSVYGKLICTSNINPLSPNFCHLSTWFHISTSRKWSKWLPLNCFSHLQFATQLLKALSQTFNLSICSYIAICYESHVLSVNLLLHCTLVYAMSHTFCLSLSSLKLLVGSSVCHSIVKSYWWDLLFVTQLLKVIGGTFCLSFSC